MSNYSPTSIGDIAVYALFALLSVFTAALVVVFFMITTAPLVAAYPADSGAQEIVLAVAMLWGAVAGSLVAVVTLGPWHRNRKRGAAMAYDGFDDERHSVPARRNVYYMPAGEQPKRAAEPSRAGAYARQS